MHARASFDAMNTTKDGRIYKEEFYYVVDSMLLHIRLAVKLCPYPCGTPVIISLL